MPAPVLSHDPLCPTPGRQAATCTHCQTIELARADERNRMTLPEWTQVVADARAHLRAQIAAEIEAVPQVQHESVAWMDGWDDGMEHAARIARGES